MMLAYLLRDVTVPWPEARESSPARGEGLSAEALGGRGTVCRVSLRVVQLTPGSTLTPNPCRDLS